MKGELTMSALTTKEAFMTRIRERIGDDTSDEAIQFIEDMTDTYDELEKNEGEDWKKRYEENDKQWREKYTSRFYSTDSQGNDNNEETGSNDDEVVMKTFDDLFVTK